MQRSEFAALWAYLAAAYPNAEMTPASAEVFYAELADLPIQRVEQAAREWVRGSNDFPPSIGRLREIANQIAYNDMLNTPSLPSEIPADPDRALAHIQRVQQSLARNRKVIEPTGQHAVTEREFCRNPACGLGTYVPARNRQDRVCGFCGGSELNP